MRYRVCVYLDIHPAILDSLVDDTHGRRRARRSAPRTLNDRCSTLRVPEGGAVFSYRILPDRRLSSAGATIMGAVAGISSERHGQNEAARQSEKE